MRLIDSPDLHQKPVRVEISKSIITKTYEETRLLATFKLQRVEVSKKIRRGLFYAPAAIIVLSSNPFVHQGGISVLSNAS